MSLCLSLPLGDNTMELMQGRPGGGAWGATDQHPAFTEGETEAGTDAQTQRDTEWRLRARTLGWGLSRFWPVFHRGVWCREVPHKWQRPQGQAERSETACALWELCGTCRHALPAPSRTDCGCVPVVRVVTLPTNLARHLW